MSSGQHKYSGDTSLQNKSTARRMEGGPDAACEGEEVAVARHGIGDSRSDRAEGSLGKWRKAQKKR